MLTKAGTEAKGSTLELIDAIKHLSREAQNEVLHLSAEGKQEFLRLRRYEQDVKRIIPSILQLVSETRDYIDHAGPVANDVARALEDLKS